MVTEVLATQNASSAAQVPRYGQLVSGLAPSGITVGASPFTYQNTSNIHVDVLISGGTVTTISISRDGVNFFAVGLLAGQYRLSPGDSVRVVYVLAPTMTLIPF